MEPSVTPVASNMLPGINGAFAASIHIEVAMMPTRSTPPNAKGFRYLAKGPLRFGTVVGDLVSLELASIFDSTMRAFVEVLDSSGPSSNEKPHRVHRTDATNCGTEQIGQRLMLGLSASVGETVFVSGAFMPCPQFEQKFAFSSCRLPHSLQNTKPPLFIMFSEYRTKPPYPIVNLIPTPISFVDSLYRRIGKGASMRMGGLEWTIFVVPFLLIWVLPAFFVASGARGKERSYWGFLLISLIVGWLIPALVVLAIKRPTQPRA
jgi:hypothetical protein